MSAWLDACSRCGLTRADIRRGRGRHGGSVECNPPLPRGYHSGRDGVRSKRHDWREAIARRNSNNGATSERSRPADGGTQNPPSVARSSSTPHEGDSVGQ